MVETKSVGVHYKTSFNQILRLPKIRAENKVYLIFGEVYQTNFCLSKFRRSVPLNFGEVYQIFRRGVPDFSERCTRFFGEVYQAKSQKPLILLGFRWVLASLLI